MCPRYNSQNWHVYWYTLEFRLAKISSIFYELIFTSIHEVFVVFPGK